MNTTPLPLIEPTEQTAPNEESVPPFAPFPHTLADITCKTTPSPFSPYLSSSLPDTNCKAPPPPILFEEIDHPSHYTSHPSGVECITVVEHFDHLTATAMSYMWRHMEKGNPVKDLKKARWFLTRRIDFLEGKKNSSPNPPAYFNVDPEAGELR